MAIELVLFALCAFVVAMVGISIACALIPRFRPAFPYAWRFLLYSSLGILLANVLVYAYCLLLPILVERAGWTKQPNGTLGGDLGGLILVTTLLAQVYGPFFGSMTGFFLGALTALGRAARASGKSG